MMADIIQELIDIDAQAENLKQDLPKRKLDLKTHYDKLKAEFEKKERNQAEIGLAAYKKELDAKEKAEEHKASVQYLKKREQLENFVQEKEDNYIAQFMDKVRQLGSDL